MINITKFSTNQATGEITVAWSYPAWTKFPSSNKIFSSKEDPCGELRDISQGVVMFILDKYARLIWLALDRCEAVKPEDELVAAALKKVQDNYSYIWHKPLHKTVLLVLKLEDYLKTMLHHDATTTEAREAIGAMLDFCKQYADSNSILSQQLAA